MSAVHGTLIDEVGVYQLTDEAYLADPVTEPSLNNSVAKVLIGQSPRHAWFAHPRLGAAPDLDGASSSEAQDVGHVAHQMFLHGESSVRVINVTDFRSNKAKELRDRAIAEGVIPLKMERYDAVRRVVEALERFRQRTGAFTAGKPEQTLIWREGGDGGAGHWGRAKVDWLPDEPSAWLWDLKTTSGLAQKRVWSRVAFDMAYDMQASYYPRGAEWVRGEPPEGMRFAVIETKPPYGIRVYQLSPAAIEVADAQVRAAIDLWARCRESGEWPGYSDDVEYLDPPYWKLTEWSAETRTGASLPRQVEDSRLIGLMHKAGNLGG